MKYESVSVGEGLERIMVRFSGTTKGPHEFIIRSVSIVRASLVT